MGLLTGILNIQEAAADRTFVETVGQQQVYDAITTLLAAYNADLQAAMNVFVERTTTDHKLRYKLPGGGRLERRSGLAVPGAVKAGGSWDVAFPLEDFGRQFGGDEITLAYMTVAELDRHLTTITQQDMNTVRFEMLKAFLNNAQDSFVDPIRGTLLIEPLANGDSVVYPPVVGSEAEATDNHYLESGYLASAISDTNDPVVTMVNELEEHFGVPTGGSLIVIFHNNAETAKLSALARVADVPDRFVAPGTQTAIPTNLPSNVPGKIHGRHDAGAWLSEWRWIPANYMVGIHLEAPRPLVQRIDPEYTNLGQGLQLVATYDQYPLRSSIWRHRFGLGVGNRLNGVVMELGNGGTYTVPTAYA